MMCKETKYINIQTGEELDLNRVNKLKDNAMLCRSPHLFNEWDFEKNDKLGLDVYKVTKGSNKKVRWVCQKCKSSYDAVIGERVIRNRGCSYCSGRKVNNTNSLFSLNPDIASEWHPTKNGDLTPHDVTCGSGKKVWWKCRIYENHKWEATISSRTNMNTSCPYCSHNPRSLKGFNDLLTTHPSLASEWHPTKNGNLKPDEVSIRSGKKVWWLGECGHEWKALISNRSRSDRKNKCPYCSTNSRKVLKGFNDIHTTNPQTASLLVNLEDGYKYSKASDVKLDWKCPDCGNVFNRAIKDAIKRGIFCVKCGDGMSAGEKIMYFLLSDNGIAFDYDKSKHYSRGKRFDFFLPDYNSIIEIHGEQHSKQATGHFGRNRTLEDELKNDEFKKEIAIKNGIENYFEINIINNNINEIRKNIENSGLLELINVSNIDWNSISIKSQKSLLINICKYYSENSLVTTSDIAYLYRVSQSTVIKYLKIGNDLKICDYKTRARYNKTINRSRRNNKPVVQLSINNQFIKKYNSISDAHRATGINNIGLCCRENYRTSNNFKWMFLSDYEKQYGKLS